MFSSHAGPFKYQCRQISDYLQLYQVYCIYKSLAFVDCKVLHRLYYASAASRPQNMKIQKEKRIEKVDLKHSKTPAAMISSLSLYFDKGNQHRRFHLTYVA